MRKGNRYMLKTESKIKPAKGFTSCSLKIFNHTCSSVFSLVGHLGRKFPTLSLNPEWLPVTVLSFSDLEWLLTPAPFLGSLYLRRRKVNREEGPQIQSAGQRCKAR